MTDLSLTHVKTAHAETGVTLPGLWAKAKETLKAWQRRDRDRRFLARMSAYERADLAVPAHVIEQEILKPFWRA